MLARPLNQETSPLPHRTPDQDAQSEALQAIVRDLGQLSLDLVDVATVVTDANTRTGGLRAGFDALVRDAEAMQAENRRIVQAVDGAREVTEKTRADADRSAAAFSTARGEIEALIAAVSRMTGEIQGLRGALDSVRRVSGAIDGIAK